MQLTILGRYSPYPPPGGACPSYLVQTEGVSLLLDCGSGAVSRLQKFTAINRLKYVVLSHLHGDHCSDMSVLRYAADLDVRHQEDPAPIRVFAPGEPRDEYARLTYKEAIRAEVVTEKDQLELGPFEVRFAITDHPMLCHAVSVRTAEHTIVYSGDTAYSDELTRFARDADVLLAECSLPEDHAGFRGHMTALDCARMAERAGVGRLLLTHFWPRADVDAMVCTARGSCTGVPVEAAEEGRTYRLT